MSLLSSPYFPVGCGFLVSHRSSVSVIDIAVSYRQESLGIIVSQCASAHVNKARIPFNSKTGVSIVTPPWRSFAQSALSLVLGMLVRPLHTEDVGDGVEDLLPKDHVRAGPCRSALV